MQAARSASCRESHVPCNAAPRLSLETAILLVGLVAGCNDAQPPANQATVTRDVLRRNHVYDAGDVFAHDAVFHNFTVVNSSDQTLRIAGDSATRTNCWCVNFGPSANELLPGASCTMSMNLAVGAEPGPLSKGGRVEWTASDGQKHYTMFTITANVVTSLVVSPTALDFTEEEILSGATKQVRVSGHPKLTIDWSKLTAQARNHSFRADVSARADGADLTVSCVLPESVFPARTSLAVVAPLRGGPESLWGRASADVILSASHGVTLGVSPSLAMAHLDEATSTAQTKIVLTGESIQPDNPGVSAITAPGWTVDWTANSKARVAIVDVRLVPVAEAQRKETTGSVGGRGELVIQFAKDSREVRVPFVLVRSHRS